MCNLPYVSYEERLLLFGLERLELRRLHYDLIELFKIVYHFTDCSIYNVLSFNHNNTRGHRFKLATVRCKKNVYKHFFINRITNIWNSIPDLCFNTNLISCFRNSLLKINFNEYLHGRL